MVTMTTIISRYIIVLIPHFRCLFGVRSLVLICILFVDIYNIILYYFPQLTELPFFF